MASYFGEITPLSSRAVDDEDLENQPKFSLLVERKTQEERQSCKAMVLSVGDIASAFLKCYFLPDNSVLDAVIKYSVQYDKTSDGSELCDVKGTQTSSEFVIASIYFVHPNILLGEISSEIPDELCYDFSHFLNESYSVENCVLLTTSHISCYKTDNHVSNIESPFLKCLTTSKYLVYYNCNIQRLQQPNFLTKFPAALLTTYECLDKPAICVINYQDNNGTDSSNVEIFKEVLKMPLLSELTINSDASSKLLRYYQTFQSKQSNLYT